jgi:hypothetical protein
MMLEQTSTPFPFFLAPIFSHGTGIWDAAPPACTQNVCVCASKLSTLGVHLCRTKTQHVALNMCVCLHSCDTHTSGQHQSGGHASLKQNMAGPYSGPATHFVRPKPGTEFMALSHKGPYAGPSSICFPHNKFKQNEQLFSANACAQEPQTSRIKGRNEGP